MFKDYYAILEIDRQSSAEKIRTAYRFQSKKWHPDLNPGKDVTWKMQDINEAYAILKDPKKKVRYDHEYDTFYRSETYSKKEHGKREYEEKYEVHDEHLKQDIQEAKQYADDLVAVFFNNLKKTSKDAAIGAWNEAKGYVWLAIIMTIIGIITLIFSQ